MIPPEQNSSFVANMEMVLDVYKRPFDPRNPVVWTNLQNNLLQKPELLPSAHLGNQPGMIMNTSVVGYAIYSLPVNH